MGILISNTKRTGQIALYERLSRDDNQGSDPEMQGESNSITNRKQSLESYNIIDIEYFLRCGGLCGSH